MYFRIFNTFYIYIFFISASGLGGPGGWLGARVRADRGRSLLCTLSVLTVYIRRREKDCVVSPMYLKCSRE